jgi:hypothetical protein
MRAIFKLIIKKCKQRDRVELGEKHLGGTLVSMSHHIPAQGLVRFPDNQGISRHILLENGWGCRL